MIAGPEAQTGDTAATGVRCPKCGALVPVNKGFVTWCDACGWNVEPYRPDPPKNVVEALLASAQREHGRKLFHHLLNAPTLEPRPSPANVLAFGIAALLDGFPLVIGLLTVTLLVQTGVSPLSIIGALVCLWAAVELFGRMLRNRIDREGVVTRDSFPATYEVVSQVARALGAPRIDIVVVDGQYRVAFYRRGWSRRKVLYLGLPLFSILNTGERVAALSYALAHSMSGDPRRSFLVRPALDALARLYQVLRPEKTWGSEDPVDLPMDKAYQYNPANPTMVAVPRAQWNLASMLAKPILLALSSIPYGMGLALTQLLWSDMQRADYEADAIAARAAGTDAMLSLLEKLYFAGTFQLAVEHSYLVPSGPGPIEDFRRRMAQVPDRELERIRRVERLAGSQFELTLPPSAYRVEMLLNRCVPTPTVIPEPDDIQQMDHELASVQTQIDKELLLEYDPDPSR